MFRSLTWGTLTQDTVTGFLLAGVGHIDPTKARENPNFLVVDNSALLSAQSCPPPIPPVRPSPAPLPTVPEAVRRADPRATVAGRQKQR